MLRHQRYIAFLLAVIGLCGTVAVGQTLREGKTRAAKKFKIEINVTPTIAVSISGEEIPLTEITSALSQKLRIPITLSPQLQKQRVTLDIVGYSLEQTVLLLAPRPVLDSVVSGEANAAPRFLAVYLQSFDETPPEPHIAPNALLSGAEGSFDLDEQNNEAEKNAPKKMREKSLRVKSERGLLSVHAQQQTLLDILTTLATEMNVICEIQGAAEEKLDVDFSGYSLPSAVQALSPRLRFYLRQHLQTNETQLWRIVLTALPTS
ncbi:MAG: hypothetical protein JST84_11795 [Acidobacteria bacterium]|nr:hypothetical protein [Acidobacteriota bacterium]